MLLLVIIIGFIISVNVFLFSLYLKSYKKDIEDIRKVLETHRKLYTKLAKQIGGAVNETLDNSASPADSVYDNE